MNNLGKPLVFGAGLLVLALVAALVLVFLPGGGEKKVVADFPRTVSLYEGSDVKILGVPVGKVDKVVPVGTVVRVSFHYDDKYKVPADAKAVVISPSIVGDRFVQLTPAYEGGQVLPDGARLSTDRTATPLELDEIFGSLNDLNIALGPNGANKSDAGGVGPLTRLLDSTARNFGGQGVQFNRTLKNFGQFTKTLADNKDQFFSTITQLQDLTATLEKNDGTVRRFNDSLAQGAALLAGEREELAAVLRNLSTALTEVRGFVQQNKASLSRNIKGLNRISKTLVKRRDALDKILSYGPQALNNLYLAGNVKNGTLDTRDNVGELLGQLEEDPTAVLCTFVGQGPGGSQACDLIRGALATPRAGALGQGASTPPTRVVEPIDPTLGGLVEVSR